MRLFCAPSSATPGGNCPLLPPPLVTPLPYLSGSEVTIHEAVIWSDTVGLTTRPVYDQKICLGLGLAVLVLFCETRYCHARRHNDLEGHSDFSSTIYSFSFLCLEHHYCGDQQWRSFTYKLDSRSAFVYFQWSWSCYFVILTI